MDLLHLGVSTAVRSLLLELLDKASLCAGRLTDPDDSEALHDFRVALRRLNTNQRAYSAAIGIKPGKAVRRLARKTNEARDREVQLAWLCLQRNESIAHAHADLDELIGKLEQAQVMEREQDYPQWQARFGKLAAKLRRRLDVASPDDATQERFAGLAGAAVAAQSVELEQGLAAIAVHGDDSQVHATRITVKRLRYLLEPLAAALPGAPLLIKRLKALQEILGDIHDCQVRLDDFAGRKHPERAEQYAALKHATDTRRAHLLLELQTHWLGEHTAAFMKSVRRVLARLK